MKIRAIKGLMNDESVVILEHVLFYTLRRVDEYETHVTRCSWTEAKNGAVKVWMMVSGT